MAAVHAREKAKNPTRAIGSSPPAHVPLTKPVRFVTNNEEPQTKRRRISAACRTCQKRKIRCSGERPHCKTCLDSENDCQGYVEQVPGGSKPSNSNRPRPSKGRSNSLIDESSQGESSPALSPPRKGQTLGLPSGTAGQHGNDQEGPSRKAQIGSAALQDQRLPARSDRKCVPYFRYFGPTAIVPGYKQMVVELNQEASTSPTTTSMSEKANSPPRSGSEQSQYTKAGNSPIIPSYKKSDSGPISPLIKDLCESFFKHLGCNYPFLTRKRFMQNLEERTVDPILVDAVCAIAARFSTNPALRNAGNGTSEDRIIDPTHKSKYGQTFARRAMTAMTEAFACPNLAAVQACLLLAYEQFGSDRDSGLWIYLGLSIRMAQDLGMHKLEGLRYEGHLGPTPKTAKSGALGRLEEQRRADKYHLLQVRSYSDPEQEKEIRRMEKERIDTFWAIFFLDRVVSSGTGRPVSLRDKDIEISFPSQGDTEFEKEWPDPFPALIRIVYLYGRVANLLNNIREVNQVTQDIMQQLVAAEDDLIGIYQRLSPNLHFSAANFQHYLKHSQATNFVLLHFWFHTLIVLVHQPTLLDSFEGRIQQLFPNSIELSLSSAKTIADILSFAELLDSKSFIGNPFTSQPMYIAACAFLLESATHATSNPQQLASPCDQPNSPFTLTHISPPMSTGEDQYNDEVASLGHPPSDISQMQGEKDVTKESLLAAAASRNYQRCYKALKALENYWLGTKYIVTVLDQKAKGSLDPLLYTAEDLRGHGDSRNPETLFGGAGWGEIPGFASKRAHSANSDRPGGLSRLRSAVTPLNDGQKSSKIDPSQAIGWSLAGSTNSPDSHLSLLYQTTREEVPPRVSALPSRLSQKQESSPANINDTDFQGTFAPSTHSTNTMMGTLSQPISPPMSAQMASNPSDYSTMTNMMPTLYMTAEPSHTHNLTTSPPVGGPTLSDLSQAYPPTHAPHFSSPPPQNLPGSTSQHHNVFEPAINAMDTSISQLSQPSNEYFEPHNNPTTSGVANPGASGGMPRAHRSHSNAPSGESPYSDMIIESQDVDASALGMDTMLWLDYMPPNLLGNAGAGVGVPGAAGAAPGQGKRMDVHPHQAGHGHPG